MNTGVKIKCERCGVTVSAAMLAARDACLDRQCSIRYKSQAIAGTLRRCRGRDQRPPEVIERLEQQAIELGLLNRGERYDLTEAGRTFLEALAGD
jgi:hypothetical protein